MYIQVWKRNLFGKLRLIRKDLTLYVWHGAAYATSERSSMLMCNNRDLAVSDELASQALNVARLPCPNTHLSAIPFTGSGPGWYARWGNVECGTCGHTAEESLESIRHPAIDCLQTPGHNYSAWTTISEADWDPNRQELIPPTTAGALVIQVLGRYRPNIGSRRFAVNPVQAISQ